MSAQDRQTVPCGPPVAATRPTDQSTAAAPALALEPVRDRQLSVEEAKARFRAVAAETDLLKPVKDHPYISAAIAGAVGLFLGVAPGIRPAMTGALRFGLKSLLGVVAAQGSAKAAQMVGIAGGDSKDRDPDKGEAPRADAVADPRHPVP